MKRLIFTLLISLFYSTFLYADVGEKQVKLLGNVKQNTPNFITPKYINEHFETISVVLYNPWEKKRDKYSGVLLSTFVQKLAKKNTQQLISKAIDDYKVVFTKALWSKKRILLVNQVNDNYITIREKGPLRIVFLDYDSSSIEDKNNLSKWMWLIKSIEFK